MKGGNNMRGILVRAMESQIPVEIIYMSNDGTISQRKLRVLALNENQIKAYCFLRKKYRVFNLLNILSIAPVNKKYKGAV
jgi:predicted DNA-binding transcriptional regulator YafY